MSDDIRPFRIEIPDADLDDLRRRLAATRYPDAETVDDWSQGIPLSYVRQLVDYWADGYDWRDREERLNRWPQYLTEISVDGCDPVDIHFVHARAADPDAPALLLTHGWPGSVAEFQDVIGPLTDPGSHGGDAADAFHVVCPSLPGYGFSGKPTANGWTVERVADAWGVLMERLGYDTFFAQGGDWGSMITTAIGIRNPEHCAGIHLNMPLALPTGDDPTPEEQQAMDDIGVHMEQGSGYSSIQSTRPQTLGYGLADSPVGQLAWIVEKFHAWTDNDGDPTDAVDRDHLLDNVMLYWVTDSGASSARLYWESFANPPFDQPKVPVGCSIFPREIVRASERWALAQFGERLTYFNTPDRGGHFAAFEVPDSFVDEVRACFRAMR